ncbi:MAG: dihydropyrimidinase [Treponema sp.]|jgi:dihydropyrimidinase|nr:dihydropyrimidinase [Treponema sp.]
MVDLLIKNGRIVSSQGIFNGDIAIEGETITGIYRDAGSQKVRKVIDAGGKYLLPGVIDTHTHIEEPFQGLTPLETWASGSRNAAMGGVTTTLNFSIQDPGKKLMDKIREHKQRAGALSCIDFNFHGVFTNYNDLENVSKEIEELVAFGVPSIKAFTIYTGDGLYADDWALYNIMLEMKKYGGFVGIHAENMSIGENLQKRLKAEGKLNTKYWPMTKPNFVEAEAVQRVCLLAEETGVNLYVVHTSTKEGVDILSAYKRKGLPIYCETCPHYLFFTDEIYSKPGIGVWQIISPPLRKAADNERLLRGIAQGEVHIIGSDHNAYHKEPKEKGYAEKGMLGVSNGGPGILEGPSALYSGAVCTGRITLERLVQITSENPAKMFGLYPRKGVLAPGSDADIVIFDPRQKKTLGADLYQDMDWTVYEGMELTGFPSHTIVRGNIIVEDGVFKGKEGTGRFIPGKMDQGLVKTIV